MADSWLYFGCRSPLEDYLYKQDLEAFVADGTLSQLRVAFSRSHRSKEYVQDLMRKDGAALCDLIAGQQGFVYVCGDGAHMAKDVHLALVEVLTRHGSLTEQQASDGLAGMARQGRYVRDVWSS